MRSFIAIELSKEVILNLSELQQKLKECRADIRWVKPENIHLTLKFFGNINENEVDGITEVLKTACKNHSAFRAKISGAGLFPDSRFPKVLWVGIDSKEAENIRSLQKEVDEGLQALGYERERRGFIPHLTLGRFRSSKGKEILLNKIEALKGKDFGFMNVGYLCLMKSELGPAGAKYTKVAEVSLGEN